MPKTNPYKSIASATLLVLFFATIVSRDFYHSLGHKDEVSCAHHDMGTTHFHELEKCNICDHNFSAGNEITQYLITAEHFIFITFESSFKAQFAFNLFFQNPDSRGSPFSA